MKRLSILVFAAAVVGQTFTLQAAPPVAKPAELIALLNSNAPNSEKVKAFKPLAVFGDKEAVAAIAPYLADEELSSWARIALEAIPDPSCDDAFRKAEGTLTGRQLIGVINSIGVRKDAKAVDALIKRLDDTDADVAVAAAAALGRIGGDAATAALEKAIKTPSPGLRDEVSDELVRCAEKQLAAGSKEKAIKLFDLVAGAEVAPHRALEGVRGSILAQGAAGVPKLVELLRSNDKFRFGLGLKMTREMTEPEVTTALLVELKDASSTRQPLFLLALADRADPRARDALLRAAREGTGDTRLASIRSLKTAGDATCAPVLLDAAVEADSKVSEAAVDVLSDLPSKEIDDLLVQRLSDAKGNGQLVLIELAGLRHIDSANPILLKLAAEKDASIRRAAITALGATVHVDDLAVVINCATQKSDSEDAAAGEAALRAACGRMSNHDATTAKIAEAMAKVDASAKCTLLGVLVTIGGEKALKIVSEAAKDADKKIRAAGYKALGEWTTDDAGAALADLIKNGDPDLRVGATRAYIRIARQFVIPNEQRQAMFCEIMSVAQRDDERRLALDILKQIRTPESLTMIVGYLDQPNLRDAAARVAVTMSDKMVTTKPNEVTVAMNKVLQVATDKDVIAKARGILNRAPKK